MSDKTSLPNLAFVNVATPTNPKITLVSDSLKGSGAATLSAGITDSTGSAPTLEMMLTFKNTEGKYLQCTVPAAGFTSSTVIAGMKRGIAKSGIDLETEVSDLDIDLLEGSEVVGAIPAQLYQLTYNWIRGASNMGSGGNALTIGDGTASNNTLQILDDSGALGLIRRNDSTDKAQFSNDGTVWVDFDNAGVGVLTAGDGIQFPVADTIAVDLLGTATDGLEFSGGKLKVSGVKTSSGSGDENKIPILDSSGDLADGFISSNIARTSELITSKFGGDGSDGALDTSGGTVDIDLSNDAVVVKNYTSINVASNTLTFSNPNSAGTLVILKSQGAVVISATIVANFGADAGTGGASAAANGTDGTESGTIIVADDGTPATKGLLGTGGSGSGASAGARQTNRFMYIDPDKGLLAAAAGAGGGGGAAGEGTNFGAGGAGGRGGGALLIQSGGALNFTGTVNCNAASAANGSPASGSNSEGGGGGGGGAGGHCLILWNTLTSDAGSITVAGGGGGNGGEGQSSTAGFAGGGGSGAGSFAGAGGTGAAGTTGGNISRGTGGASGGGNGTQASGGGTATDGSGGGGGDNGTSLVTENLFLT